MMSKEGQSTLLSLMNFLHTCNIKSCLLISFIAPSALFLRTFNREARTTKMASCQNACVCV